MLDTPSTSLLIGTIMFNKESLQEDIDDLMNEITNITCSYDCLDDSDTLDDVWANLENISDEAAKLANLADALLARVKAMK